MTTPSINATRLAEFNWAETPLGDARDWSVEMSASIRMLMASDFPMCSFWGPHQIQIYNDACSAMFGEKHPHSFGAPAQKSWPEIWSFFGPALNEVMLGKSLWFCEALLPLVKSSSREECYFDFSCSPVHDSDGHIMGILNVTAERTAEVVLRRRQALLQLDAALGRDNSFEALIVILHDILARNEMDCEAAALFSVAMENGAPDGEYWTLRADQDLVGHIRPLAARALRSGALTPAENGDTGPTARATSIPFFSLDGDPCWALVIIPSKLVPYEQSFLPFAETISQRVHAALHAIERRHRAIGQMRERIAEQDQVYQFLFDNIRDGIAYCATTGTPGEDEVILAANARLCDMLGYQPTDVVGMSRDALFKSDGELKRAFERRDKECGFRGELELETKDGRQVPVEISSDLIEFSKGQIRSLTLVRDITHHKQAERERIERVRIETIANLAGALAHDTNNLMTIVIGSAETLADSLPKGGAAHQMALNAMAAAERTCGLTSQLLTYSHRQPPAARPIDLRAFLHEIRPLIVSALGEMNTLIVNSDADVARCLADPSQLATAILNLATNARHAMPDGGSFTIETYAPPALATSQGDGAVPALQQTVGLRLTDTGSGIPVAIQGRIFEPFFTTKDAGSGSGLGLSIVQQFVQDLGGTLNVESSPGRGTIFELGFRAAPPEQCNDAHVDAEHWPEGDLVLYVEHNDTVRWHTEALLRQIGAEPVAFDNARKALAWIKDGGRPAALLTDLVLPGGISGRELATKIRRLRPDLPVVITTGHHPRGHVNADHDTYHVLQKPYTKRTLESAMMLQRRHVSMMLHTIPTNGPGGNPSQTIWLPQQVQIHS